MNSSKNVGRKRLGRIPITSAKPASSLNRPCQIPQRTNGDKKNISRSDENHPVELSFSSSFAHDLDLDVDLMSALDKMETEYGSKVKGDKTTKTETHTVNANIVSKHNEQNQSNITKKTTHLEFGKGEIKTASLRNVKYQSTPARISNKINFVDVPVAENSISNSFHDLSFASPMEISTPQIFKAKRSVSSSTRSSASRKANLSATKKSAEKNIKAVSKIKTSTPQFTPRRSLRTNSGQKRKNQLKKKRVLDGLEDSHTEGSKDENPNKSDFFRSLMVENVSLEETNIAQNDNVKKIKPTENHPKLKSWTDEHKNKENKQIQNSSGSVTVGDTNVAAGKDKDCKQVNARNQSENNTEINLEDLPHIPTRGGNTHDTSNSASMVGKTVEIQPDLEADQLALSSWGLPDPVLKQYHSRHIIHMFQWQAECLLMGNVLGGGNLVYSAPTSAGKTMVAELLVLKRVMETRKKAIIILPFVSVTREKMFYLQDLYQDAGIRVSGFMGHYAPAGGFSSIDVAVCTIEKGNSLINRMLEENKLDQLGIIVIDELHLIGDRHRGYLLELLLTKISYMSQKAKQNTHSQTSLNIQVVGMSATLPNLDLLAQWLNADLYRTDYRPVPLSECVKIGTALYDSSMNLVRDIDTKYAVKGDEDHVVPLCIETIRDGHSILIFCPTKNWCEKLSETVARELYNLLRNPEVAVAGKGFVKASDLLVLPLDQSALRDIIEQLRRTAVGLDSVLGRTVQFGVAYHHAGLTFDERDIIEGAFRQGILKVLIATSTLSSGVNLPARRVLIRTPVFHGQLIDFLTYKQMIGRAGRKGVDTAGESILLCKPSERPKAEKLVKGALPAVQSTLVRSEGEPLSSSMKRAILEVVVSGVAMSPAEVSCYASCTLLAASLTKEEDQTKDLIQQCVQFLQENEFVCTQKIKGPEGVESERFVPTQLGAAVLASSISPDEGLVVFSELQRARQCFVLENELHIIYQVTPIYAQIDSIDWYQYFSIWETLTIGMRKVAELVGIQESFLAKAVRGRILTKTSAQLKLLAIHKRFYTALVLHDLVQETPLNVVARKYNCNKGQLQSLQQSAATFAGMVTVFCARLGWSNLELILSQFQNRLTFGVQRELCDLVRISALNGQRARVMYNGGYQTVAALASAHPADVEALLKNSAPFQSNKKQDTESEWEAEQRRKTRCIFLTGRKGVTEYEAALAVITEAKSIIQEELGGLGIQWKEGESEPPPALKSPVLLSPLAATRRNKKGQNRRLSNPKSSKKPSPCNKGDNLNKQSAACVISPPATKSGTKVIKGSEINVNKETNSRSEIAAKVADVIIENTTENLNQKTYSNTLNNEIPNGDDRAKDKLSDSRIPVKKIIIDKNVTDSEKFMKENENVLVNLVQKRNENLNIEERNGVTTTAVIETVPNHSEDVKSSDERIITKETVNDMVKCQSESNTMEFCEQNLENTDICLAGNIKRNNQRHIVSDDRNVQKRLEGSKLKELHTSELLVECGKATGSEVFKKGKVEGSTPVVEQDKQSMKNDANKNIVKLVGKQNQIIERIKEKHIVEESNRNANNVKLGAELNSPVNFNTADNEEVESNAVNPQNQDNEPRIAALNERDPQVLSGMCSERDPRVMRETCNESDFGESFMIDTQSLKKIENSRSSKTITENACTVVEKEEKPILTTADLNIENEFSEGLFTEDLEMDSFNASNRNILPCDQSQSHGRYNKPVCPMKGSQSTGRGVNTNGRTESRFSVSDSESEVDISQNALDMNISQCSGEDMFNQSADLVAASNYERVVLTGDSRIEAVNDSYQDLHIPYQSGQEKCFEKTDAPAPIVANVVNVVTNLCVKNYGEAKSKTDASALEKVPAFGQQLNILGQFSSQRPAKTVVNKEYLHEDLAIALEMGESFSSTFNVPTQSQVKITYKNNIDDKRCDSEDNLGDSLTVSMVEKVLEEPVEIKNSVNLSNSNNTSADTANGNIEKNMSKHICDKNSKSESIMKLKQSVIPKTSLNYPSEKCKGPAKAQFLTPKREAVKRLRGSPSVRDSKMRKTKDVEYSTPEALEKHTRRTNKSNDKNNVDDCKVDHRSKRKRKSNENVTPVSEKSQTGSVSEMNTSTGSDCVPPTPPDEAPTGSLLALVRTPARSPVVNLPPVSPFSPRLKRNCRNQLSSLRSAADDQANHKPAAGTSTEADGGIEKINRTAVCAKSRDEETVAAMNNDNVVESKHHLNGTETKSIGTCNGVKKTAAEVIDDNREKEQVNDENCEMDVNKENEDFLSPSFIDPDESGIQLTQSSFSIIDVCGDKRLFKTFIMEWRTKARYAVSLACERMSPDCPGGGIGANFKQGETPAKQGVKDKGIPVDSLGIVIVGIAVSWDNRDAYYVSFTHEQPCEGDPDDSLAPPPSDTDISIAIRVKAVKSVLQQAVCKQQPVTMVMFDVKAHFRALAEGCGFAPKGHCEDPKVACWMLDPGAKEKNLHRMVTNLLPTEVHMLHGVGGGIGVSSLGMSPQNPGSGRYRATTEAVLVRHLGEYFRVCLEKEEIYGVFRDVEMPSAVTLCRMELNGFGFSQEESENQKTVMTAKLSALEEQAYMLAGHPFSLSATEDVAQILYVELQFPPNGDPTSMPAPRSLAPKRGGAPRRGRGKPQYSTSKDILEKLKKLHPLPGIILEWRRITNALTKTVFPLQKEKVCYILYP
ncbi:DNA polymerase theta-like [Mercenaria mercenaria]|uniref:DNA polymerase theta-like n=1 Tax=Mercenaria mercenaria TaxID=6596 RepID=UPI00234E3930|nr:DNA polymerase theta-like [Mercenaria mercenaria]